MAFIRSYAAVETIGRLGRDAQIEEEEAFYGPFLSQEEAMEAMAKEYPGAEIDLEE